MTYQADALADRRRLRRKISFWRAITFMIALVAVIAAYALTQSDRSIIPSDHIARVEIEGVIGDNREQRQLLRSIKENERVKGLIISINSPGGTTAGAEALYLSIRDVAEEKPVVATLGTLAASGGYIAAIGADHIIARGNTLAGSIGVIFQWPDATELLDRFGLEFNQIKSSSIKAEPTPFTETPEEARLMIAATVRDSYQWFIDLVTERRDLNEEQAEEVGDARILTGRAAIEAKLVDAIGGEDEAKAWLVERESLAASIKIRTYTTEEPFSGLSGGGRILAWTAERLGFGSDVAELITPRPRLDGLISLWHPDLVD